MPDIVAVTKARHGDKSWQGFSSFSFASSYRFAPLFAAELPRAVLSLPMAFIKRENRFVLCGILSMGATGNCFVAPDGKWLGGYIPSVFRSFPFRLAKVEGQTNLVLCVDEDSGLIVDDKGVGQPFFDDAGNISKPLQEVIDFLNAIEKNRKITEDAVSALSRAGVIAPWHLEIDEKSIGGLYRIDETRLQKVEDAMFNQLRKTRALPLAYGQLFSMGNMAVLKKLDAMRANMASTEEQPTAMISDDGEFIRFDE
jgi:hypothetical protein